eukprot:360028-Chlamydomonas_euryale.AAC.1
MHAAPRPCAGCLKPGRSAASQRKKWRISRSRPERARCAGGTRGKGRRLGCSARSHGTRSGAPSSRGGSPQHGAGRGR